MLRIFFFLLLLSLSSYAMEEAGWEQSEQSQPKQLSKERRSIYHNPFLNLFKAPTKKEEKSLQEQMVNYIGTFISSSPYPGIRATFEGTELMSQLSNVNQDLQILIELKQFKEFFKKKDLSFPKHPRIFISGEIETTANIQKDTQGKTRSDINLTDAEIDFLIIMAPWLYGFLSLEYENIADPTLSEDRTINSRFRGDTIFVVFGDLDFSPWYVTIGQVYPPFGQYNSYNAIHNPLTYVLFRTRAREVALGFYNETWQLSSFVFKGSSHADSGNNINNYGTNFGYHFQIDTFDGKLAVGTIRNIADSQGMQIAFGESSSREKLKHGVPGLNVYTTFTWGKWHLLFEYNQAMRPFNSKDMAFSTNNKKFKGAMPRAFDMELAYSFSIKAHPSSLALSHSRSYQALGFNVPKERTTLTWAIYVFRQSLLSFELNSDKLYDSSNRALGKIVPHNPYFLNTKNLGHRDYSFGIDFLLYF